MRTYLAALALLFLAGVYAGNWYWHAVVDPPAWRILADEVAVILKEATP